MPTNDVDHRLSAAPTTGYIYRTSWPVATGDLDGEPAPAPRRRRPLHPGGRGREPRRRRRSRGSPALARPAHRHRRHRTDRVSQRRLLQPVVLGAVIAVVHDARRSRRQRRRPHRDRGLLDRHQLEDVDTAACLGHPHRAVRLHHRRPSAQVATLAGRSPRRGRPSRRSRCAAPTSTSSNTSPTPPTGTPSTK